MPQSLSKVLTTFLVLSCVALYTRAQLGVYDLRCEHLRTPLGIDNPQPRFSWKIKGDKGSWYQNGYCIDLGTDSLELVRKKPKDFIREEQQLVKLENFGLKPFTKYYWKLTIWGKDNDSCSAISSFETGMLNKSNWQGVWISDVYGTNVELKPAPYFRKGFNINKKIKGARAYVATAGLFELQVNGKKIGDHKLDPMYTRFDRRTLYVTHDITAALQNGENSLGVILGNGWYNHQSTAVWNFHNAPWRDRPTFCMDVRIEYTDGTVEVVKTDNSWKTSTGAITFNSIYTAEHWDFRKELYGWSKPAYSDTAWKRVYYRSAPSDQIVSQTMVPIRNVEKVLTKSVKRLNDSTWVFDLGRNISGVSEFKAYGKSGTMVRLIHGERLKKDGHVDQSNIDVHYRPTGTDDPFQTDIIILNVKGENVFQPKFGYKGFQYVEVISSAPIELTEESLCGYFMHSDVEPIGLISSSNETINKIWSAANNSYLSNLMGYPTDCPQREKNGWTGDAHIASETGLFGFDAFTVYEKWMADHRDEQQPNGVLPSIIPTGGWGYEWGNGPDWTSTIAIIPWNLYMFTGDAKPLADTYENLKAYVDHIDQLYPSGICSWGLGDWVPVRSKTPVDLTSTAYYFKDVTILAEAANLFEKEEDAIHYKQLGSRIAKAYQQKFYKGNGIYGSGFQTELAVSLDFDLVPDSLKSSVMGQLVKAVENENFHLDVGLLGTRSILNALSDNGRADVAYKLASQETFPSWGWWIKNGATTLYENWDINAANDISLNHIMFGAVGAWLYKGIGGISPMKVGFSWILFEPNFFVSEFNCEHDGPKGKIISSWKTVNGIIEYTAVVPPNSTGILGFDPNYQVVESAQSFRSSKGPYMMGSGTWSFKLKRTINP